MRRRRSSLHQEERSHLPFRPCICRKRGFTLLLTVSSHCQLQKRDSQELDMKGGDA